MNQSTLRLACVALFLLMFTIFGCSSGKPLFRSGITYKCDDGRSFVVEFYENVDIAFLMSPEETFYLHRMPSASGVKYSDGNTTLWIKGDTAFVEANGRTEFNNCSVKPK